MILESRFGADAVRDLDLFLAKAQITLVPVDADKADFARRAFREYGKGRHLAGLNFGDCFSYALAQALDEPLLFSKAMTSGKQTSTVILPADRNRDV